MFFLWNHKFIPHPWEIRPLPASIRINSLPTTPLIWRWFADINYDNTAGTTGCPHPHQLQICRPRKEEEEKTSCKIAFHCHPGLLLECNIWTETGKKTAEGESFSHSSWIWIFMARGWSLLPSFPSHISQTLGSFFFGAFFRQWDCTVLALSQLAMTAAATWLKKEVCKNLFRKYWKISQVTNFPPLLERENDIWISNA